MQFADPLGQLLLQLVTILIVARVIGRLAMRLGQPAVIGEMAAGIMLGPSLLGWIAPSASLALFPVDSLGVLRLFAQIGVCLFLFVVGMGVDMNHLRNRASSAVIISQSSIVVPAILGICLATVLFRAYAGHAATFTTFALFMGISMSITAFPVLARILDERRLSGTPLGAMALTCAAVDDVSAWSMLAAIVAIAHDTGPGGPLVTLGLVVLFVLIMLFVVRRLLPEWMVPEPEEAEQSRSGIMVGALALMLMSALATELIGIHALFGAFLAGAIMPRAGELRQHLVVRIEDFSTLFLLPLFFVFTGLRTSLTLIGDLQGWLVCLGIVAVAIAGKLGGSYVAARWTGMSSPDAFALGALMNTRGLMELIALNLGYDLGILSPRIFSMLVVMALVTTALTGPLLGLAERWRAAVVKSDEPVSSTGV